jgi:hypothetical protein
MKNETIKRICEQARNEDLVSSHSVEKFAFQSLLSGMIAKLLLKKGDNASKQLAILQRMDRFIERLTYVNIIFITQAKMLAEQDRQIILLEQEKEDLIQEIETLKKNIQ